MKRLPTSDEYVTLYTDGSVIFSELGIEKYRALFGRAGFDIRKIRNVPTFHDAMRAIGPYELDDLKKTFTQNGQWYQAESRLLEAVLARDESAVNLLSDQLQRRKKAGLKLITSKKKQG